MPCTLPASLADAAVCRGSFHAVLGGEAGEAVFADFSAALQKAQAEGRILTASLFRYENHLFFYAEGLNRPFTPQGLCPALDAAPIPKATLHVLRRSRRPTRTAATTLYFCPALRERRTEP